MNQRILISIVTIDRDASLISMLYQSIRHHLRRRNIDLLIVCRESDILCQRNWIKEYRHVIIIKVDHYEISGRYNLEKISEKRNICLKYAQVSNYDYVFFIDSDVLVQKNTLKILIQGCEKHQADLCVVPYFIRGLKSVAVGKFNHNEILLKPQSVSNQQESIKYKEGIGGMGCALIKKSLFEIPFTVSTVKTQGNWTIQGEDIGFYLCLIQQNYRYLYVKNHSIHHQ